MSRTKPGPQSRALRRDHHNMAKTCCPAALPPEELGCRTGMVGRSPTELPAD